MTSTNQQKRPYLNDDRIYKTWYKRAPRYQHPINRPQIPNAPQFSYISGGEIFSHIMRVYIGGGFRLAIMRVYICGKIFALHNTHIKYGENPKIIMQKPPQIHKNFSSKNVYVWAIFKASCNTSILDPKPLSTLTIYRTKESFTFQNRHSKKSWTKMTTLKNQRIKNNDMTTATINPIFSQTQNKRP